MSWVGKTYRHVHIHQAHTADREVLNSTCRRAIMVFVYGKFFEPNEGEKNCQLNLISSAINT